MEYSYANVFFASMVSNLFHAFGKQGELQSRVKGQIPEKEHARVNSWAFHVWRGWAQQYILLRETECDPVPELMISRQKIGLLVIVSRYGSRPTSTGYPQFAI